MNVKQEQAKVDGVIYFRINTNTIKWTLRILSGHFSI